MRVRPQLIHEIRLWRGGGGISSLAVRKLKELKGKTFLNFLSPEHQLPGPSESPLVAFGQCRDCSKMLPRKLDYCSLTRSALRLSENNALDPEKT